MTRNSEQPRPLILLQSAPYAGSLARSSLDLALSFAVFSQRPAVVFCGDAVMCLKAEQNTEAIGRKSLRKVIDSLPLYDIDRVFVDALSLEQNGLNPQDLPVFAVSLSTGELQDLIRGASHVISL
ncbi:DsrE family protein [Congregibacter sp.]|jgi:tRNA 2-thiouridine synthesizing protein C|uniref:DsrE family protein n=1 Tax=Congregibacter sp. TaxID=2744308 RepID=UPI0039E46C7E